MNERNYYIVHSVKGGCGKSAISFFIGLITSKNNEETPPLIIDTDLKASVAHEIFNINKSKIISSRNNKDTYCLNKYFNGQVIDINSLIHELKCSWISKGMIKGNDTNIDYIFANDEETLVSSYQFNIFTERNDQETHPFNVKNYFQHMIKLIECNEKEYKNIIVDMAPSFDEYSYLIFRELLDLNRNKNNNMYLVLVTTNDHAHIFATKNYLKQIITGQTNAARFKKIYIIVNQISSVKITNHDIDSIHDAIKKLLNECTMSGVYELVDIIILNFQNSYYDFTRLDKQPNSLELELSGIQDMLK